MRERTKERLEIGAGIAAIGVVLVCALGSVPNPNRTGRSVADRHSRRQIARLEAALQQMQAQNTLLENGLGQLVDALQNTRADMAGLARRQQVLDGRVATTTNVVEQLQATVEETHRHALKLSEFVSLHELLKERDDARNQAKDAGDRIRELTLRLQREGIYP